MSDMAEKSTYPPSLGGSSTKLVSSGTVAVAAVAAPAKAFKADLRFILVFSSISVCTFLTALGLLSSLFCPEITELTARA